MPKLLYHKVEKVIIKIGRKVRKSEYISNSGRKCHTSQRSIPKKVDRAELFH